MPCGVFDLLRGKCPEAGGLRRQGHETALDQAGLLMPGKYRITPARDDVVGLARSDNIAGIADIGQAHMHIIVGDQPHVANRHPHTGAVGADDMHAILVRITALGLHQLLELVFETAIAQHIEGIDQQRPEHERGHSAEDALHDLEPGHERSPSFLLHAAPDAQRLRIF